MQVLYDPGMGRASEDIVQTVWRTLKGGVHAFCTRCADRANARDATSSRGKPAKAASITTAPLAHVFVLVNRPTA